VTSSRHDAQEVGELGLDLAGCGDGVGDFVLEHLAVALAQAVDGDAEGALGETQLRGELHIRDGTALAREAKAQLLEKVGAVLAGVFGAQALGHGVEEGERPLALENCLGGGMVGGFVAVAELGGITVEGDDFAGVALLGVGKGAGVGEVVLHRGEEEGAEAAPGRGEAGEGVELEEPGEEALRQVLGIVRGMALAADESVERIPISLAQTGEGFLDADGIRAACGEDDGPMGGGKARAARRLAGAGGRGGRSGRGNGAHWPGA